MKIAIVGTSTLTTEEKNKALKVVWNLMSDADEVITGDATGIDYVVRHYSKDKNITVIKAPFGHWEGKGGFKQRNIKIATKADKVYSISTKIKHTRCYHCDKPNHERTGGCWTKRFAMDKFNKPGETIII